MEIYNLNFCILKFEVLIKNYTKKFYLDNNITKLSLQINV
jgi:hypothetical protein